MSARTTIDAAHRGQVKASRKKTRMRSRAQGNVRRLRVHASRSGVGDAAGVCTLVGLGRLCEPTIRSGVEPRFSRGHLGPRCAGAGQAMGFGGAASAALAGWAERPVNIAQTTAATPWAHRMSPINTT